MKKIDDRSAIIAAALAAPVLDNYHLDSKDEHCVDCEGIYNDDEISAVICVV